MKFAISNLPYTGFQSACLQQLSAKYDLEIFYEFGSDIYWQHLLAALDPNCRLSLHAPCMCVNLADPDDKNWRTVYTATLEFAAKIKAEFVVVHTNEAVYLKPEETRSIIEHRLQTICAIAAEHRVTLLIENVGLRTKNLVYDWEEFQALLARFPRCGLLIDTGHARVNNWDLPALIQRFGNKITAFHLHDNDGSSDAHFPIGRGSIAWPAVFQAIKTHSPNAKLILEYAEMPFTEVDTHINSLKVAY